MQPGVNIQDPAAPEKQEQKPQQVLSDKARENFERLERAKEAANERAYKAEMQAELFKQRLEDIEKRLQPKEVDPLDSGEEYVDTKSLKVSLDQREKRLKKEAGEIAETKLREWKKDEEQKNHMQRLQSEYVDYGQIMNEENIVGLEKTNPEFLQSLLHIQDDYERKKLAYNYLKRNARSNDELRTSIKEKVEENAKNPYHIPPGSGNPGAVEFDIKSPQARQAAYAKLKAAQKRPIGGGPSQF